MLRLQRTAASATLALSIAGVTAATHASAGAATTTDPASRAVHYLAQHLRADGSLDDNAGETDDLVLGAAAAGIDPSSITSSAGKTPVAYLATQARAVAGSAGSTAKLILAVLAAKRSPASFGGVDLYHELAAQYHSTGAYGDGSTFGQALSILAVAGGGRTVHPASVTWLAKLQNTDGSWSIANASGSEGDTNSTSVAIEALEAAGDTGPVSRALQYLHGQQNGDGGFPYQNPSPYGTVSDPDSDSLVLEALAAAGQSLSAWTVNGHTPLGNLLSFQVSGGGFVYPGNTSPDTFTTSECPQGAERDPLPLHGWNDPN